MLSGPRPDPDRPVEPESRFIKGREIGREAEIPEEGKGSCSGKRGKTDLCGISHAGPGWKEQHQMKTLTATGAERAIRDEKRSTMESNIVDTMRRYFQNDTGKSKGDLEYTIINSVKRYFEGKPPER